MKSMPETISETCKKSKMKLLSQKIVKSFRSLILFAKTSKLEVWQCIAHINVCPHSPLDTKCYSSTSPTQIPSKGLPLSLKCLSHPSKKNPWLLEERTLTIYTYIWAIFNFNNQHFNLPFIPWLKQILNTLCW